VQRLRAVSGQRRDRSAVTGSFLAGPGWDGGAEYVEGLLGACFSTSTVTLFRHGFRGA